jgi:hypothetical protein
MKTKFTVCFRAKDHDGVLGEAVLDVELPFAPTPEIEFEHPTWGGARKPTLVIFDLGTESFLVSFGIQELDTKEQWAQEADAYRKAGWTVR